MSFHSLLAVEVIIEVEAEAKTAEAEAVAKATLVEIENLKKILREHNIDI